jgi:hypothetical protein
MMFNSYCKFIANFLNTFYKLQAHFEASTLSVQMIAEKLNVTTEDVEKALAMKAPLGIFSHQLQRFIHLVWDVRNILSFITFLTSHTK